MESTIDEGTTSAMAAGEQGGEEGASLAAREAAESRTTFEDLGLAPEVLQAVREAGYVHPTPIQEQAIPLARRGRDLIGLAQTGTGKTAAFTLPIIDRLIGGPARTRALILTPTRELCIQVEESFQKYGRNSGIDCVAV